MDKIENEYIETQANFALKLLRQTQKPKLQSSILSPISISTSLAIVYNGAAGETAKQIADVIAEGKSQESINQYFSSVLQRLQSNEKSKFTLKAVNRLYADKRFEILKKFSDTVKQDYNGQFNIVDFQHNLEGARKRINEFIKSATNNLIKDMIKKDVLRNDTCLIFVNAMYFLVPEDFYVSQSITKKVNMMKSASNRRRYRYEKMVDYEILGLDYEGDYTMFILLPNERFGLSKIIKSLDGQTLTKHAKNKKMATCYIKMPKFSFNLSLDLLEVLQNLGIKDAFDEIDANFSNLTDADHVHIYAALHQSYIKVNEKGTEMASCTAIAASNISGGAEVPPKVQFIADHSFLYFVADLSGNILFIGTVVDNFQDDSNMPETLCDKKESPAAKKRRIK